MTEDSFSYYESSFIRLHERLVRVLGVMTVNRLVERSITEIVRAHPALEKLRADERKVDFSGVRVAMADLTPDQVRDAFMALDGVLVLLVARLLGREIASRLTEGVTLEDYLPPDLGGGLSGQ